MLTVAWHVISPPGQTLLPAFLIVTPEQFEAQVRHLMRIHEIVGPRELRRASAEKQLPRNACALTFDDGHVGHHRFVLPILQKLGLQGFFFVPTCIPEDGRLPIVEKQRIVQYAAFDDYRCFYDRFCEMILQLCPEISPQRYLVSDDSLSDASTHYAQCTFYSPVERLYRKVRDCLLTGPQFDGIICRMFEERYDERMLVEESCLDWTQMRELLGAGMDVGGHGHDHLLEAAVSVQDASVDCRRALDLLETRLGTPVKSYAYPYGNYRPQTLDLLREREIRVGFTCEAGLGMLDGDFLQLDRLDCKDFPLAEDASPCQWSTEEAQTAATPAGELAATNRDGYG